MSTVDRRVQYEFKVIVRAGADEWPHELADAIKESVNDRLLGMQVVSVEQIRDYP